jgi:inosine-uridine nucleoside N-ribohydrolase
MNSDSRKNLTSRRELLAGSAGLLIAGAAAGLPRASVAGETGGRSSGGMDASESSGSARTAGPSPAAPLRIIIDTDPGVDDAMAILLALRSPELKVEAITPVSGNVPLAFTLPNALRLVEIAGRTDVPVAAGASVPLVRSLITASYVHGNNGLGGVEFAEPKIKPVAETATEIIRRIVRASPGEITIVAVGPLTNIATVLRSDPEIAKMIRAIVIMGGSLTGGNVTPAAEFNLYVDPEAARIVFDAGVPLTMVGLNVTEQVLLNEGHVAQLEAAKNPAAQAAAKIMRATLTRIKATGDRTVVAMHDPLTVAHLIDPSILTLKDYYVTVETSGEWSAGQTLAYSRGPIRKSPPMAIGGEPDSSATVDEHFKPNTHVAVGVDPDRFFKLLISRLTASA